MDTSRSDIPLISLPRQVRKVALPMTRLITILARLIGRWSFCIIWSCVSLRKRDRVTLAKSSLHQILPNMRVVPHIWSWCMVLGFRYHWCLGLRGSCLKSSSIIISHDIKNIIVLLHKSNTHEVIECSTLVVSHGLH